MTSLLIASMLNVSEVQLPITSYHTKQEKVGVYNTKNYGILLKNKRDFKLGIYKNSIYKTSLLFAYDHNLNNYFGVSFGVVTGYGYAVLPVTSAYANYKSIRVDAMPYNNDAGGGVAFALSYTIKL